MPAFDTPKPISATVTIEVGTLRIVAGDRTDTVVDVRPSSPSRDADVRAAERTRVEYSHGKLLVKGPKERSLFGKGSSVDVDIALPAGSEVRATSTMGHITAEGALGESEFKTSAGDLQIERTAGVRATTGFGDVRIGYADGAAHAASGSGEIRLGEIRGEVVAKNSNGPVGLGDIEGDVTVKTSNGSVTVDRAAADVSVKTACGSIQVGELVRGTSELETAAGKIDVGIREGTAAWLDVRTGGGVVRQSLEESGTSQAPADATDTLKLRARSGFGDITVHRA
ncbi:DUF4097 family beta strand repeat-containing protein [Streptomyces sp. NPDC048518]|uniref:DUF4097 family beta strand repeat-containing protein n=1 Tax=Streptomyces sp. NPDC048518 TaxID=3155029 RepID=UPI00340E6A68